MYDVTSDRAVFWLSTLCSHTSPSLGLMLSCCCPGNSYYFLNKSPVLSFTLSPANSAGPNPPEIILLKYISSLFARQFVKHSLYTLFHLDPQRKDQRWVFLMSPHFTENIMGLKEVRYLLKLTHLAYPQYTVSLVHTQ